MSHWRNLPSDQARVRAIERVVHLTLCSGHLQIEALVNYAPPLDQAGGLEIGNQPVLPELINDNPRPLRDVLVKPSVYLRLPIVVQRTGPVARASTGRRRPIAAMGIAPPGRLPDDSQAQFRDSLVQQASHGLGSQRTSIVEMFVDTIDHPLAELRVMQALLPDPLRVAARILVAGRVRASTVLVDLQKCVLRIPNIIPEALVAIAVTDAVPVVGRSIRPEGGDRRIEVTAVKDHKHVID